MTETDSTRVGAIFQARRLSRQLAMRDVAAETATLETQDPERYTRLSHQSVYNVEKLGTEYLRTMETGKLRALVQVLWPNDGATFQAETGFTLFNDAPAQLPLYAEGASGDATTTATPALPGADFLVEVRARRLAPALWPGQVVGARRGATQDGDLCALRRGGALTLAYQVRGGRFSYPLREAGEPATFALGRQDEVIGPVVWIERPRLPQADPAEDAGKVGA